MTTSSCPFPDGVVHDHGNSQCHEASYRAGAVDALREAADVLAGSVDDLDGRYEYDRAFITCTAIDVQHLRDRADLIARGERVTS